MRGRIKELDCLMGRELPLPLDKKERSDFRVRLLVSVCASLGVDSPNEEAVGLAEAIEKNFFKDTESSLLRLSARSGFNTERAILLKRTRLLDTLEAAPRMHPKPPSGNRKCCPFGVHITPKTE